MRDSSVIWPEINFRIKCDVRTEELDVYDADLAQPAPVDALNGEPRTGRARDRRSRGLGNGRGRLLITAGLLSVLSAAAFSAAGPTDNNGKSQGFVEEPVVLPHAAPAAPTPGAVKIRGSVARAIVLRISPTRKLVRQKAPVKRPIVKPTATATGSAPAGGRTSVASGSPIAAGNSKANCASVNFPGGVFSQSVLNRASNASGIVYNCLMAFDTGMPAWSDWENPWPLRVISDGWDAWLAASREHQLILAQDLIPQSVSDDSDPLTWEQACADGDYERYATGLGQNLVAHGAGNLIIRLGLEANGSWEADYVGTTSTEMKDWAKCYDNEVTAMRAVPGAKFLFVWNPNICTADIALSQWYPGNSYVDIIGADAYDEDCQTLETVAQEGWTAFSTDSSSLGSSSPDFPSLANIESFAVKNRKPMSLPEWGLEAGDDDPAYVTDLAKIFAAADFSFESYFDLNDDGIAPLGSTIPNATAAYVKGFS